VEEKLEKPIRMFNGAGRAVIITHSYAGNPPADPPGYYYHYEDRPGSRHWISCGAVGVRFTDTKPVAESYEQALVLKSQVTKNRREQIIAAAKAGVDRISAEVGAVSIVETDKGFCVVFDNDERMYFDTLEM